MTAKTKASTDTANRDDAKRFAELIGPTDPKLDREVREMLVTARVGMLLRASFFGNLATRLKLVNADEWCATAALDIIICDVFEIVRIVLLRIVALGVKREHMDAIGIKTFHDALDLGQEVSGLFVRD